MTIATKRVDPEKIARYLKLSTCQVSDAMDKLGVRRGGAIGIVPLEPGHRIAGPAFTVAFAPKDEVSAKLPEYLTQAEPGDVVVIANRGRLDCSVWGGLRSATAKERGCIGTVADGCYRDVEEHRRAGYPVFGRGATMMSSRPVVSLASIDEPIDFAGVRVFREDLVVADDSGVLIVPAADADRVLEAAEQQAAAERAVEEAVRGGERLEDARRKYLGI